MSQRLPDTLFEQDRVQLGPQRTKWFLRTIIDLKELPLTVVCSALTTAFTLHAEGIDHVIYADHATREGALFLLLDFILHPSPTVMILACILLGCSVSSFIIRHRREDRFQAFVFAAIIVWGALLGYGVNSSLNLVMLGFVPWSMAIAMVVSSIGHSFGRWWWRHRFPEPLVSDQKGSDFFKV